MIPPRRAWMLLAAIPACGGPPPPDAPPPPPAASAAAASPSIMGAIVGANLSWGDALVRGDTATLARLYTDDATLMTSEGDVSGRAAILDRLVSARRSRRDSLNATSTATDQLDAAGNRAYEAGTLTYTLIANGGRRREVRVRYVTFWQQGDDGRWRIHRSLRPLP